MLFTLSTHISEVENDLPATLVSAETMARLKKLSSLFPYDLTRDVGFESHLNQEGGNADFLFSVKKQSPGYDLLADRFPVFLPAIPEPGPENWKHIHRFAKEWHTPGTFFNQYVDTIWFEFDHEEGFHPENLKFFMGIGSLAEGTAGLQDGLASGLIVQLMQTFPFAGDSNLIKVNFVHCISCLPPRAKLYHTGIHLKGEISGLRIVLVNVDFDSLLRYLKEISWPGNLKKLRALIDSIGNRFDYFAFNLDLGERVYPKLGIECYLMGFRQPVDDARWESNLSWMVENGWCLPGKKEGLLSFSGNHDISHFYRLNYRNSLNHMKLVFCEDKVTTVKAYFGTYIRSYKAGGNS